MSRTNNRELILIDYEYAKWNPMAYDIANFVNESMVDNAYPAKNGVAWFPDNMLTVSEIAKMGSHYLKCYYNKYMPE